jgi:hypothetical protein
MPTVEDMRRHVEKLLAGLSRADDYVEVRWIDRPTRAHASLEAGVITVPRIRSAISYATALHEVGHFLGRHQRSRSRLVRERWAWVWARRNARESLDWYAARMEDDALCGLQPQQSAR